MNNFQVMDYFELDYDLLDIFNDYYLIGGLLARNMIAKNLYSDNINSNIVFRYTNCHIDDVKNFFKKFTKKRFIKMFDSNTSLDLDYREIDKNINYDSLIKDLKDYFFINGIYDMKMEIAEKMCRNNIDIERVSKYVLLDVRKLKKIAL